MKKIEQPEEYSLESKSRFRIRVYRRGEMICSIALIEPALDTEIIFEAAAARELLQGLRDLFPGGAP